MIYNENDRFYNAIRDDNDVLAWYCDVIQFLREKEKDEVLIGNWEA